MPSFWGGQIRVNLREREAAGIVALDEGLGGPRLVRARTFLPTGTHSNETVVGHVERTISGIQMPAKPSQCDVHIIWKTVKVYQDFSSAPRQLQAVRRTLVR